MVEIELEAPPRDPVDLAEIGIGRGRISLEQVDRDLGLAVRLQHAQRIGRPALRVEVRPVDDVAAIGGEGDPADRLHVGRAWLGELAGHARDLHHLAVAGFADHRRHLQQQVEAAADLVGAELGEGLGAVAALQQEALAPGDLGQLGGEQAVLGDRAKRRAGLEAGFGHLQRVRVRIGRHLQRRPVAPGGGGPAHRASSALRLTHNLKFPQIASVFTSSPALARRRSEPSPSTQEARVLGRVMGGDAADDQGDDPPVPVAQAIEDGQLPVMEQLDPPAGERAELDHRDRLAVTGAVERVLRRAGRDDRRRAAEAQPRLVGHEHRLLGAVDDDIDAPLRLQIRAHQLAPDGGDGGRGHPLGAGRSGGRSPAARAPGGGAAARPLRRPWRRRWRRSRTAAPPSVPAVACRSGRSPCGESGRSSPAGARRDALLSRLAACFGPRTLRPPRAVVWISQRIQLRISGRGEGFILRHATWRTGP